MVVYLDHAATTPLRPSARDAWLSATESIGNPSSIHGAGQGARRLLEDARERIAAVLDCDPIEVVFTSGGTESVNLALVGMWEARRAGADRIVVPAAEHHATLDTAARLERRDGARVTLVDVDEHARVRLDRWAQALGVPGVAWASLLTANNEVGAVQPVQEAVRAGVEAGVPVHLDAVGSFGHVPLSFRRLRADTGSHEAGLVAVSVAAHKLGGPVGIGALVVSRSARLEPLVTGGGQQRGLRAGTQDVAGAMAFAVAAEEAARERESEAKRLRGLRDRFERRLRERLPEVVISAERVERLPGHIHLRLAGAQGDSLLLLLDMNGIAVSTGSACQAGTPEPSHVLRAMGCSLDDAQSALRISLGASTSEADVDALLDALPEAYERARRAGMSRRDRSVGPAGVSRS